MIDYTLALALKKLGFPQQEEAAKPFEVRTYAVDPEGKGDRAYLPSLLELMEACSPEFVSLERYEGQWLACGDPEPSDSKVYMESSLQQTPERAVADLWIKLQEKRLAKKLCS